MKIEDLNKDGLIDLIECYDNYIQEANDDDSYRDGWRPVCIDEFLNNEYVEMKEMEEE